MSILDAIILEKISEVEKMKETLSLEFFTKEPFPEIRNFKSNLLSDIKSRLSKHRHHFVLTIFHMD